MAVEFSVKADVNAVRDMLGKARAGVVNKAAVSALNKTAKNVQVEASKQIRRYRNLPAHVIKDALIIVKARAGMLRAIIHASGKPVPLRDYAAHATKAGVTVLVSPEGGRKLVSKYGNKAFEIARSGNNVFVREGDKRLPIEKLYGPSIPTAMVKQSVEDALRTVAGDNWPKRFKEELTYRLQSLGFTVR